METLHKIIQDILVNVLKEFGIDARKEFLNIDVIAKKDDKIITIEIETSYDKERATKNLEKCLFINPTKHIHILIDGNTKFLKGTKEIKEDKVKVLTYSLKGNTQEKIIDIFKRIEKENIPTKEKVKKFMKKTGLSRRTYFRIKKFVRRGCLR